MAGDWIKFDCDLPEKPEVWALAERMDLDPDAVVGKLLRVWRWFDAHTEDGNAPSVTRKLLDREVGVTGFADAMIDVGWLIDGGHVLSVSNFDRHNGKTAKNRALTARRVAQHKRRGNDSDNGEVTQPPLPDALPREEKRRERPPCSPPSGDGGAEQRQSTGRRMPRAQRRRVEAQARSAWKRLWPYLTGTQDTGGRLAETDPEVYQAAQAIGGIGHLKRQTEEAVRKRWPEFLQWFIEHANDTEPA